MKIEREIDSFLANVTGVIHVGASRGQERYIYDKYDLNVVWIEPIPEIYDILVKHIEPYPKQSAFQCLIADIDDKKYRFRIADNKGESSSMLDFKVGRQLWPKIRFVKTIILRGITLATLLKRERIKAGKYDALVLDTQGSELLVLNGAIPILNHFKYIKVEVADFEAYKRGCQTRDIEAFMKEHQYKEIYRHNQAIRKRGYHVYDIVYQKENA